MFEQAKLCESRGRTGRGKTLHDLGIGFKPVTSSLGIHPYIESKSLARFCCDYLNLQHLAESAFPGFRVVEVPVSYYPRIGKSKIGGTLKGTAGAAWFIFSLIVRYHIRRRRAGTPRPA
jgi:hypothetical protein